MYANSFRASPGIFVSSISLLNFIPVSPEDKEVNNWFGFFSWQLRIMQQMHQVRQYVILLCFMQLIMLIFLSSYVKIIISLECALNDNIFTADNDPSACKYDARCFDEYKVTRNLY
jgi:hypothetical protein